MGHAVSLLAALAATAAPVVVQPPSPLLLTGTPAHTVTVDPGATIVPALAEGAAATSGGDPASFYRVRLNPGTYEAATAVETVNGDWVHLVGLGDTPAATVIQSDDQNLGTLYTHSGIYLENLTVRAYSSNDLNGPRYAWHISLGTMVVAKDCVFDIVDAATATSGGFVGTSGRTGADGDNGMTIIFHGCTFRSNPAKHPTADNMHGPVPWTPTAEPMTVAYIDCTFEGAGDIMFEGTGAIDGRNDELYVIGCTGVTSISGVNSSYPAERLNTDVFTDDPAVTVTNAASTTRGVTEWPEPVGGLSAYWADAYS